MSETLSSPTLQTLKDPAVRRRASGGALRVPQWNAFVRGLGFGREMEVAE